MFINLTKFFDAVYIRYRWAFKNVIHECVWTTKYNTSQVITTKTGGFVTLCHIEIVCITKDTCCQWYAKMSRIKIKHYTKKQ